MSSSHPPLPRTRNPGEIQRNGSSRVLRSNLELTMSNTKLKRMGKEKLQKLFAELTEAAII